LDSAAGNHQPGELSHNECSGVLQAPPIATRTSKADKQYSLSAVGPLLPELGKLATYRCPDVNSNLMVTWTGSIAYGASNSRNPTNATPQDPKLARSARWEDLPYVRSLVFGFLEGSPAPGLGIQPMDLTRIGSTMARPTVQPNLKGNIGLSGTIW
jgi:hypothetical protein